MAHGDSANSKDQKLQVLGQRQALRRVLQFYKALLVRLPQIAPWSRWHLQDMGNATKKGNEEKPIFDGTAGSASRMATTGVITSTVLAIPHLVELLVLTK